MLAGKAHLELLDQHRRLYLKARALSLAQVGFIEEELRVYSGYIQGIFRFV